MALFDDQSTQPVYNTRAVVQRTGVPADTFRAWERRYGLPVPARTDGNQRLYSEQDIATISWLRDQTESGMTVSKAVQLFRSSPSARKNGSSPSDTASKPAPVVSDPEARMARFSHEVVEALSHFDSQRADRVVEEALAFLSVEDVCLHVLQPALQEIGHRWARGEASISSEHFASAFVIRKLGSLFNLSQPEIGRGPIVAACLEGELHEVGLLLTCLFLSRRGMKILYLGPNLPLEDLLETIQQLQPPMVLLSASTPESANRLARASKVIQRRGSDPMRPAPPPVVGFGGSVFGLQPDLREQVEGIYLGDNADSATAAVDRVLADGARRTLVVPGLN